MRSSISEMEVALNSFREFTAEIQAMHRRWTERVDRIQKIEDAKWVYQKVSLPEINRKSLEALKKTATERMFRDEERFAESQSVLKQMESRLNELRQASKDFRLYNTLNALEGSSEMSGGLGNEISTLMKDSRQLAARANAYIEIEAGKNV